MDEKRLVYAALRIGQARVIDMPSVGSIDSSQLNIPAPPTVAFSPAEIEYLASLLRRIEALERRVRDLELFNTPDDK